VAANRTGKRSTECVQRASRSSSVGRRPPTLAAGSVACMRASSLLVAGPFKARARGALDGGS
jgi:hypothetical protein